MCIFWKSSTHVMCFDICNLNFIYLIFFDKNPPLNILYINNIKRRILCLNLEKKKIGFVMTSSFGAFRRTIDEIKKIIKLGAQVVPIMSENSYTLDTKFGKASSFINEIEQITNIKVIHTIPEVESLGQKDILDILVVAPTTSNTIAKLANDISDETVTMSVSLHLLQEKPVIIGIYAYNGLSGAGENIGKLLNRKNYYFIPFRQDNPITRPHSLAFDASYIIKTIEFALEGEQIQPILIW